MITHLANERDNATMHWPVRAMCGLLLTKELPDNVDGIFVTAADSDTRAGHASCEACKLAWAAFKTEVGLAPLRCPYCQKPLKTWTDKRGFKRCRECGEPGQ